MADNTAPFPTFVKIIYHSAYAPHVQTLPARAWLPSSSGHPAGQITNWGGTVVDMDDMVQALVNIELPLVATTTHYDRYEIWTKATPTDLPMLRYESALTQVGTTVTVGWEAAVEKTYNARSTANNAAKLVLLDAPSDNFYGKVLSLPTADENLVNMWLDPAWAWQTRNADQPVFFRSATVNLNRRLLRQYHLD